MPHLQTVLYLCSHPLPEPCWPALVMWPWLASLWEGTSQAMNTGRCAFWSCEGQPPRAGTGECCTAQCSQQGCLQVNEFSFPYSEWVLAVISHVPVRLTKKKKVHIIVSTKISLLMSSHIFSCIEWPFSFLFLWTGLRIFNVLSFFFYWFLRTLCMRVLSN